MRRARFFWACLSLRGSGGQTLHLALVVLQLPLGRVAPTQRTQDSAILWAGWPAYTYAVDG